MWDFVALAAAGGVIYGTIEYVDYAGPWKTLMMIPLMLALGWMAMNLVYPLWFGNDKG